MDPGVDLLALMRRQSAVRIRHELDIVRFHERDSFLLPVFFVFWSSRSPEKLANSSMCPRQAAQDCANRDAEKRIQLRKQMGRRFYSQITGLIKDYQPY